MNKDDAKPIMDLPKYSGSMPDGWTQHQTMPGLHTLEFGIVDSVGAAVRGLSVLFRVTIGRRLAIRSANLTLFASNGFKNERCYQIDSPGIQGLKAGDHDFPHEHYGEERILPDDPSWANLSFKDMLPIFLSRCNLTLSDPIPDTDSFKLK